MLLRVAQTLVKAGADRKAADKNGLTPLQVGHHAWATQAGRPAAALAARGVKVKAPEIILHLGKCTAHGA